MAEFSPEKPTNQNTPHEFSDDREYIIKEYLKTILPEEFYERWVEHFVFEKIDSKKTIIGYYGDESLKELGKADEELLRNHISEVVGEVKKLQICKRKVDHSDFQSPKKSKNIKVIKLFVISMIFAMITIGIAIIACNYIANRSFRETFYSVSSLRINDKVRIIQISDLHTSKYGKNNNKLIDRVKKLDPDIIIYTGDCLDSATSSTKEITSLCKNLASVAPSYYIYGNNEVEAYYDTLLSQEALDKKFGFNDKNRDPQKLIDLTDSFEKELESVGVKVLKNETDTIEVGTTTIDVFGVLTSNPSAFWSYAGDEFDKYIYNNTNNLKVTAIHEPFIFEEYSPDFWGDLMICGHTHGGTVRVPLLGPLYVHGGGLFPERDGHYVYGRYEVSGNPLIVSSGLDNNNIFRINNSPELVIIDVNRF